MQHAIALCLLLGLATVALAQTSKAQTSPPQMSMDPAMSAPPAGASQAAEGFKAADDKMMRAMNRPMTGDADRDFVADMLPHHAGAVEMAQIELQFGKDPDLRRLARGIIAAQQKEIVQMQLWQKRHPTQP